MSVSFWQKSASSEPQKFDYIVVGGGVVGTSAAYWYSRLNPGSHIAIVEARTLARGASGRNAGFVLQGTATDFLTDIEKYGENRAGKLYRLTVENRNLIESELDKDTIRFEPTGSIIAAATPDENKRLQESIGPLRSAGGRAVHLSASEVNSRLSSRKFLGALLVSTGGKVDPVRLVNHIALESGASIRENSIVEGMEMQGANVFVYTGAELLTAPTVTVALNAYLPNLFSELSRYVRPVRAQMLATSPSTGPRLGYPVYSHEGYFYIRQSQSGQLLVGGARHLHVQEEVGYEDTTTRALQNDLEAYIQYYFPDHGYESVESRWSGVMGFSPDGLPSIGRVPGLVGDQYWAAGFTGHGMSIGFLFGRILAKLAMGSQPVEANLFDASRIDVERRQAASR
ncbi:MAG: FAD-binding oxidoreductase [Rhodothermales bacterium]|nr:FAD-binding oxidoreductase [Rhodothermales bacterium]